MITLSLLGLSTGITVGLVIVLFRFLIEITQASFLPAADPENYEALQWQTRFLLAMGGGLVIGLIFTLGKRMSPRVGVVHVLERMAYHEGHLPLRNALYQFFGAAVAIISGQSVGREGPSVQLGAATASLTGQFLQLPNNSIRILVGCGCAAAIAASFNTPLAGVIFAMEVIMMEYTIAGFTPVILAAVSATAVNRIVFESHPAFNVPALELNSIYEFPVIIVMGIVIGCIAVAFIRLTRWFTKFSRKYPLWLKLFFAGIGVGSLAILVPEIMGIGYDTVSQAINGDIGVISLLLILLIKLVATALCIGLSVPAGLIGPTLFIGALAGSATGQIMGALPFQISSPGLYAMLGMGAMMGATLQAPLAALLALLELTANQNIIFPAMLAIISANLAARELFKEESIYLTQMRELGIDYRNDPVAQSLRRQAVTSVMNTSFAIVTQTLSRQQVKAVLNDQPQWLMIRRESGNLLMPASDLARAQEEIEDEEIDLLEVPAKRLQLDIVNQQSTLQHALKILDETEAEALYVIRKLGNSADRIYGILTRQEIEGYYRVRSN